MPSQSWPQKSTRRGHSLCVYLWEICDTWARSAPLGRNDAARHHARVKQMGSEANPLRSIRLSNVTSVGSVDPAGVHEIEQEVRDKIVFLTAGIAVLSLLVNGTTTGPLVRFLKLDRWGWLFFSLLRSAFFFPFFLVFRVKKVVRSFRFCLKKKLFSTHDSSVSAT